MPVTIIPGSFASLSADWMLSPVGQSSTELVAVANVSPATFTVTSLNLGGSNPGDYSIPAGQTPTVINPGQTALFQVTFTPTAGGDRQSSLEIVLLLASGQQVGTSITLDNDIAGAVPTGAAAPTYLTFPTVKIGQTVTFNNYQIVNMTNAAITVTNIAMQLGVNFFLVGAPATPFVIPQGGVSASFGVQFAPTVVGGLNDKIQVTVGGQISNSNVFGFGSVLQSAFSLTGNTQGTLIAVPGVGTPGLLLVNNADLNCEESSSAFKLHDYGIPNLEKETLRVRGHYEDLGPATINITVKTRRVGQPDTETKTTPVAIGTALADGWVREFVGEVNITGELVRITISRAANSGPVSIIDYIPEYEPKGEVIGGT